MGNCSRVKFLTISSVTAGVAATLTCTTGNVDFRNCTIRDITATGGATFEAPLAGNISNNTGIIFTIANHNIFYMDYVNGLDATTDSPYGWYSVAFTGATGLIPAENEVVTDSAAHTAKVSRANNSDWYMTAGTMYLYNPSGTFVAGTVTCAGGGSFTIAGDLTYCAWKTMTSGATAARVGPGNTIRILKSPDKISIGMLRGMEVGYLLLLILLVQQTHHPSRLLHLLFMVLLLAIMFKLLVTVQIQTLVVFGK
jgi:hypothetical protein